MFDVDFNEENKSCDINVRYSYGTNPDYDVISFIEDIDLDDEKDKDLQKGKGFIISSSKTKIKKDIKNPDGIFSTRYGRRLGDDNPYMDRFSCWCGELKGAINEGLVCEKCGQICKEVGDDFTIFGWIEINKEYSVISPSIYNTLNEFFGRSKYIKDKKEKVGSVLQNMIDFDKELDQNGFIIGYKEKANEPFYGIGMIEFKDRFDEIVEYYYKKNHKQELYDYIRSIRNIIFTNSVPVYTTLLRPAEIAGSTMYFEKTNQYYNMMVSLSASINKNRRKMDRNVKMKNQQLYRFQMKWMQLYEEVSKILSGKKGQIRNLVSGRFNFSSRSVIIQNPDLRIDQVELPYVELVITLQQQIINILHRTYNISFQEAYNIWFDAIGEVDHNIVNIINDIIKSTPEGIPVIINRNPTISFGSIFQCFCVGINFNFTMSTPLQILVPLAADFDGDQLNCFHIENEDFFWRAYEVFNPRNNIYISKNNGMLNPEILPQKDTIVNANTLNDLTLGLYSEKEMSHIEAIKAKAKAMYC